MKYGFSPRSIKLPWPRLAIFDWDGVCADSKNLCYSIYSSLHAKYDMPNLDLNGFVGLFEHPGSFKCCLENRIGNLNGENINGFLAKFKDNLESRYNEVKIIGGMGSVLERYGMNLNNTIATNNYVGVVKGKLDDHNINWKGPIIGADGILTDGVLKQGEDRPLKREVARLWGDFNDFTFGFLIGIRKYFIADTKGDLLDARVIGITRVGVCWPAAWHCRAVLETTEPQYIVEKISQLNSLLLN